MSNERYPLWCIDIGRQYDSPRYFGPFDDEAEAEAMWSAHGYPPESDARVRRCRRVQANELPWYNVEDIIERLDESVHDGACDAALYEWDATNVQSQLAAQAALDQWAAKYLLIDAFICEGDEPELRRGRLLGLAGRAGSGKSSVAEYLVQHGTRRVRFAGPVKAALVAMGLSAEEVDGALKETPSTLLCGRTPRHVMQTLGTEWGRVLIGANLWVNLAMKQVDELLAAGHDVVIDDVRFDNEAAAILARGGRIVTLLRDGAGTSINEGHASEAGLSIVTAIVPNNSTIEDAAKVVHGLWLGEDAP